MKDKISIITTFYNSEKYILQCIHSVNTQIINDKFDIEYILVDDCSEDNTLSIINAYFEKYKSNIDIHIVKTDRNSGAGISKNLGISYASGNYFMFLDSDDYYIKNDFVCRAYDIIVNNNADIVEFGYKYNENGLITYHSVNNIIILENNKFSNMYTLFLDARISFMQWTKIVKRNIVESKLFDSSKEFEDIRAIPYWVYNSNKIIIMNSIEINYRNTVNSIIRNNISDTKLKSLIALQDVFKDFRFNKEILKLIYNRCIIDLRTMIELDSNSDIFNKMSEINTYMLSQIFPDVYKDITYNVKHDK